MVLEILMKLYMTEPEFLEKKLLLLQKLGKWVKNRPKIGFFNLKSNLVINFHSVCSIMKIYIIWCVPAQILCWKKSFFWDIAQNAHIQWHCRIFKSVISQEQIDETASFFVCWYKFPKIKSWFKISRLGMVKNGCG